MKLHSQIVGKGEPIVILHGFLGMGDNWKSISKKLADNNYQVHLPDARNHGKSPHSSKFSYNWMVDDLKLYFEDHDLKEAILIGHSMGGKTAMQFASKYPDYVKKLVVVDISPKNYPPHHDAILNSLKKLQGSNLKSRSKAEDILKESINEQGVRLFLLKNLKRESDNTLSLKPNLDVFLNNKQEIGEALPQGLSYDGLTLFIRGEKSSYINKNDSELIGEHFKNHKIVTVNNAGHWVHAENQKGFLEILNNFIKGNS